MTQNLLTATRDSHSESAVPERKKTRRRLAVFFLAAAVLFIAVAAAGVYSRNAGTTDLRRRAGQAARLVVRVVHPEKGSGIILLQLPGQTTPYTEAPIFAQTRGYLKGWYFDIGAEVTAGDVLAEIDTPQVDQQLAQAQAQVKVAQAALGPARVTFIRDQGLFNRKVIAAEDYDTAADTYHENQATLAADQANVDRLEALEAFKVIRAPFGGILTARDVDIGAYVAAGSGSQLFRVARISPLRVYIDVPQAVAQMVKFGEEADLRLSEFPGRTFPAGVTNASVAIDTISRALVVELQTPNQSEVSLPGAYAQVTLKLAGEVGLYTIPANAMLFRAEGAAVGVVHPDGKVEIRKINITLNDGNTLQVAGGLSETDQVIINPSDSLAGGMRVNVLRPKPQASAQNSALNPVAGQTIVQSVH